MDQRVTSVVAITYVAERLAAHRAPLLRQREKIGQTLARVDEVGESVDDGDARLLGKFFEGSQGIRKMKVAVFYFYCITALYCKYLFELSL